MPRKPIVIDHPSQLDQLSAWPWGRVRGTGKVNIQTSAVSEETRENWQDRLNRLQHACGCDKAALGMTLGVVGYLAWLGLDSGFRNLSLNHLWYGLAAVVLTTGIGKLVGLYSASKKLEATIAEIKDGWRADPVPKGDPGVCG
jgi:hypothetical protein